MADEAQTSMELRAGAPTDDGAPEQEPRPLVLRDMDMAPVEVQRQILEERDTRRQFFLRWVHQHMTEGVHFGFPPGCTPSRADPKQWKAKPTLYDAGARLVLDLLKLADEYAPDPDTWAMLGSREGNVCVMCHLRERASGGIIATGHGTMEAGEKKMPANSRVKVAKKRARVDAVLIACPYLADLFTQDLDDGDPAKLQKGVEAERRKRDREAKGERPVQSKDPATPEAISRLEELATSPLLSRERRNVLAQAARDKELTHGKAGVLIGKAKKAIAQEEQAQAYFPPRLEGK